MRIYPITKLLTMAAAFAVVTSVHAQEQSVYSVNIVGFQSMDLPEGGKLDLVASPFESGGNTLSEIFGTEALTGSESPGGADRLRFWDPSEQTYVNVGVGPDGNFYRQTAQGSWVTPLEQVDFPMDLTEGVWIVGAASAPEGRKLTLAGDVVMDDELSYNFTEGLHMVAYPFSSSIALQDMNFFESGASGAESPGGADRFRAWDRSAQTYVNYGLGPDGQWYSQTAAGAWVIPLEPSTYVLEPGQAFFYFSQGSFTWDVSNPYLSSLND